jgi:hypothetical protein
LADYGGARGSNAGDQFHEFWALQQILALLKPKSRLTAVTVEGIPFAGPADLPDAPTWDGVDCALFYGGRTLDSANKVELVQLKYSGASPKGPWTVARLCENSKTKGNNSVLRRLADDFSQARARLKPGALLVSRLVSNQPAGADMLSLLPGWTDALGADQLAKRTEDHRKVTQACGLKGEPLAEFLNCLDLTGCGSVSRFGLSEDITRDVISLIGDDVRLEVGHLHAQVRTLMLPERAHDVVDQDKLLTWFGLGGRQGLFPCEAAFEALGDSIQRTAALDVRNRLIEGSRLVLVHGDGGSGKTTLIHQLSAGLPEGSVLVAYDCYGAGRYMDSDDRRHLPERAFLQIINEVAAATELPLFLPRSGMHPITINTFLQRMELAGKALALSSPQALLIVAIDAADNAVTAATLAVPYEPSFIHEIARADLANLPANIRLVMSARTARKKSLALPDWVEEIACPPFTEAESRLHLERVFPTVSDINVSSFHDLTGGIPRVQSYALNASKGDLETLFQALLPNGKTLADVLETTFTLALRQLGSRQSLDRLISALAFLPTPASVTAVAVVAETSEQVVRDFAGDLAPGIRLNDDEITVADEDFEDFIASRSQANRPEYTRRIADHFWSNFESDRYSCTYVVDFLVHTGRIADIFTVLELDANLTVIVDPLLKREIQTRRLTLALATCRDAKDHVKSLKTILLGAEAQRDEAAFYRLIDQELDLSVEFSGPLLMRRTLLDSDKVADHGSVLAHCALSASLKGDRLTTINYLRMYDAWLERRLPGQEGDRPARSERWRIGDNDIAARTEAIYRVLGADAAMRDLMRWTPKVARLRVALQLVPRLIADGHGQTLLGYANSLDPLGPWRLVITIPLALAGYDVAAEQIAADLRRLRKIHVPTKGLRASSADPSPMVDWLGNIVSAMEFLRIQGGAGTILRQSVQKLLALLVGAVSALHVSDVARCDAVLRLFVLRASLERRVANKDDFLTLLDDIREASSSRTPSAKGKRKPIDDHEHDRRRERAHRGFAPLFEFYRGRLKLLEQSRSTSSDRTELLALGRILSSSYELDNEAHTPMLREVTSRSLSELMVLPGIDNAALCEATLLAASGRSGNAHGREARVLRNFRLRREFHAELLSLLDDAMKRAIGRRARSTEKVTELIALARLVLPFSRPDAAAFFNGAMTIAREIDEEAIDQIAFCVDAARRSRTSGAPPRSNLAARLATFTAAVSIRLDGHDELSWPEIVEALVCLHAPTAFACVARWMDDGTARLQNTLLPLLLQARAHQQITLEQLAALSLLDGGPDGDILEALTSPGPVPAAGLDQYADEIAWMVVLANGQQKRIAGAKRLVDGFGDDVGGRWMGEARKLVAFAAESALTNEKIEVERFEPANATLVPPGGTFGPSMGQSFTQALEEALRRATQEEKYRSAQTVLGDIAGRLRSVSDRTIFLDALTSIDREIAAAHDWLPLLARLLEEWKKMPAVQNWCLNTLPAVVIRHLASLSRYSRYQDVALDTLLEKTGTDPRQRIDLMLDGIAQSGAKMESRPLFDIASRVVALVDACDAEAILDWYLDRLVQRLPEEEQSRQMPRDVPATIEETLGRFLYSFLSDIDTRVRWRAAHSVRSLARLGDTATIDAMFGQHERTSDPAFRDPHGPFYGLAARLWLGIIAYRLAEDQPTALSRSAEPLIAMAVAADLPHVVIREYARRALIIAADCGTIMLSDKERLALDNVNSRILEERQTSSRRSFGLGPIRKTERFHFDVMDTLPYWYSDLLNIFPTVSQDKILAMAERWIVDVWNAPLDQNQWVKEPRRETRLSDDSYSLWSNRHGSLPVIERYNTYLEWHAMLCVAGELLQTHKVGVDENGRDPFARWLQNFLPTEPPVWIADLNGPTPLLARIWRKDPRTDTGWMTNCRTDEYLDAIGLGGLVPEGWVVVQASSTSDHSGRQESIDINSALVSPETSAALVRALQTANDPMDFRIPDEDDDPINEQAYRLTGFLGRRHGDKGFDVHDPLRFGTSPVRFRPGRRITEFLQLERCAKFPVRWQAKGDSEPTFAYEAWCDEAPPDDRPYAGTRSQGWRLLARLDGLATFLPTVGEDLILEITIERRLKSPNAVRSERDVKQKKHLKILTFTAEGVIRDARGDFGVWKKTRRRIRVKP